jgi:hypothetical protein
MRSFKMPLKIPKILLKKIIIKRQNGGERGVRRITLYIVLVRIQKIIQDPQ